MHKRKLIRDAATEMLFGMGSTGTRVYKTRVFPLEAANLPGVLIYTLEEASEIRSIGGSVSLQRFLSLMIEGYVKGTGIIDDDIDEIAEDVEDRINEDPTLDGNALFTHLAETEIIFNAESEKPIGIIKMTFMVEYLTG